MNLLRKLRERLRIAEFDHRLLEAKLGKYPRPSNLPHTRTEIGEARRLLQSLGLLFSVRQDGDIDLDVIPEEIAVTIREMLGVEIRKECYVQLMQPRSLRRKAHLVDVLTQADVEFGKYDNIDALVERVLRYVPASQAISSFSLIFGLNSDQLSACRRQLSISPSGPIEERVTRIIEHFDQLRPRIVSESDEREV